MRRSTPLTCAAFLCALLAAICTVRAEVVLEDKDAASEYHLSNGEIAAVISKTTGDLVSLKYHQTEMLDGSSKAHGHWNYAPQLTPQEKVVAAVTIDPKTNSGSRAEVSVYGYEHHNNGMKAPDAVSKQLVEIRYSLGDKDKGLYTYCILSHAKDFPALREFATNRTIDPAAGGFTLRLADGFNWLGVDRDRSGLMPTVDEWKSAKTISPSKFVDVSGQLAVAKQIATGPLKGMVVCGYQSNAVQFDSPAYGWYDTTNHVSLWVMNASEEYLGGGATRVDLTGFNDPDDGQPTLCNNWFTRNYGETACTIPAGEEWSKVIGPFLLYCDAPANPNDAITDARMQLVKEMSAWPYDWVKGVDYPQVTERASVSGRVVLDGEPNTQLRHVLVGLTHASYNAEAGFGATPAQGRRHTNLLWQNDAKYYQFWAHGNDDGTFNIPNVRAGTYDLQIMSDGVIGTRTVSGIAIKAGSPMDLGEIRWKPRRFGDTLWEIGTLDHSGQEFRNGDHYWQWGLWNHLNDDFPLGVEFHTTRGEIRRDWNFEQVPTVARGGSGSSQWKIHFDMPLDTNFNGQVVNGPIPSSVKTGQLVLRVALAASPQPACGVHGILFPKLNGYRPRDDNHEELGPDLTGDLTILRQGVRSIETEADFAFDVATCIQGGDNILTIDMNTSTAVPQGVIYDYLRMEYVGFGGLPPRTVARGPNLPNTPRSPWDNTPGNYPPGNYPPGNYPPGTPGTFPPSTYSPPANNPPPTSAPSTPTASATPSPTPTPAPAGLPNPTPATPSQIMHPNTNLVPSHTAKPPPANSTPPGTRTN